MFTFIGKRILNEKNYAISQFINSGLKKKTIEVKASSKIYRSYMHSDDMIDGFWKFYLNQLKMPNI